MVGCHHLSQIVRSAERVKSGIIFFPSLCRYVKASLELLHEKMHFGTTSRLRHYIADLKAIQIEMPVAWAEVDIRELQYPTLEAEVWILRLTCFRARLGYHLQTWSWHADTTAENCLGGAVSGFCRCESRQQSQYG